ncbi:hypothetical protein RHSIM_RhsimUnG0022400 [Rhododendron simsii]|uniref:Disease resistance protein RGA3 n=1 Tax=Rhododendron simsii TaxID=118357 RepID=A0A834FZM1_RHOSS|nr:hypothetical protein RHSIM_RhsimUnG0022400 [Rhododendron simsii]
MAEEIVVDIAGKILSTLGSDSIKQFGLAWGFKEELKKMESMVSTINNALLDAQELQMNNHVVKEWLQRLELILYNVGDLFDETRRREVETRNSLVRKVHYFFTSPNPLIFQYVMGSKLNEIEKRLDEIVKQIGQFDFVATQVGRPIETETETCPSVNTRRIIGREGDKERLVCLLLSSGYKENVPIIPVVGIGGLGNTTLAQLVYDDHRIKNHFTKRLWVCMSNDSDIKRILLKILQADGDNWHSSFRKEGLQQLQTRVTKLLSDAKFLLFLDDVWNEDIVKWNRLGDLLKTGERGSRVVVTTRSETVALIVRTSNMESYKLRGLSNNECLTILVKLAFTEGEEENHEDLVNIGKEIVEKCGGVPPAVVTLGSFLFPKRDKRDWLYVRNSEMRGIVQSENDILPIMKLSYDQMPPNLQNCFAYCSLFEKDEIIDGKKLLYDWMAQGFVQCLDGAGELEDIGEGYILELVRRSFLEPYDGRIFSKPDGREHYKMHNLVHDLAQYVAGNEYLTIKGAIPAEIPDMVQHISFDSFIYPEFPRPLVEDKKLRTIFYPRKREPTFGSSIEMESESFRCLRLLAGCTFEDGISSLEKIGKLKLLRYLGFDGVGNLPKSLDELLNLQYLDLSRWPGLMVLTSLERLEINSCPSLNLSNDDDLKGLRKLKKLKLRNLPQLVILPKGLLDAAATLTHLEIEFCSYFTSPSESVLPNLLSLQSLMIWHCYKVGTLPEGMPNLTKLQNFGLAWGFTEKLTMIKDMVSTINNALLAAQEQQMTNNSVEEWLKKLKVVLEDAGDLFDEVATETRRREVETRNSVVRKVHYFFKSSNPLVLPFFMGRKLKDIEKRIDEIVTRMRQFDFIFTQVRRPVDQKETETSPSENTRRIIGRDGDKEKLVSLLLSSGYKENVPIIPIVGIGGLGKTALAQLVYDDHRIKNHFTKRLWVCISIDFDITRILLKILQADEDNRNINLCNLGHQQLQTQVTKLLSDHKFLLFLDNVWNEKIAEWKKLEDLLIGGERGSRIVVTTRSENVAFIVKTGNIAPYKLTVLSNSDCLTIFEELAFKEGEKETHGHLVNIGKEIAGKCGGVPLAAVTLGSLLLLKREERDWLDVRNSEMRALGQTENDILPKLKLSYDQMPPNLRNCFAYCSLFEKDEIIDGKKLVYAWMAQGCFLDPNDGRALSNPGGREYYKMHNLVHDLAQYVAALADLWLKTRSCGPFSIQGKTEPKFGSSVEIESESFRCLRLLDGCTFEDGISSLEKIGKLKLLRAFKWPKGFGKLIDLRFLCLSTKIGASARKWILWPYGLTSLERLEIKLLSLA